ncbi:interleukin-5 receptor subunit alpha-like isoform X2 [Neoarius graeffei]|uniref:interleukin-5 receptor subunit alpha-like isoform X2 n=1 Tax=Neoarius graeffei TaxID=443677 RepID=UPI00298C8028|nr:interleukin-5 receptor subunit alpha-like isoform X2 [Neoarius graeffei]
MPQFNMRLCGLLLTLSLVLADENGDDKYSECDKDSTYVIPKKDHENHINSNISKITCLIYNGNALNCSWSTDSLPEDTQYSASFFQYDPSNDSALNCDSERSKKLVECQGQINLDVFDTDITVKANISINGDWYIICQSYDPVDIEKLNPPENITTFINSTNLEIRWMLPITYFSPKPSCFIYHLKINDEDIKLEGDLEYIKKNIDPTKSYIIQIRTKQDHTCAKTEFWSDWSKPVVINPSKSNSQLDIIVIVSITFVLPMILLAILLICRFQRLTEKLFPSIPNPSKNVQMLLEKNDFDQAIPPKQREECAEILDVMG